MNWLWTNICRLFFHPGFMYWMLGKCHVASYKTLGISMKSLNEAKMLPFIICDSVIIIINSEIRTLNGQYIN